MEIFLSKTAARQLERIIDYLEIEWGQKVAEDFYNKFLDTIEMIKKYPDVFPESSAKPGMRLARITRHNRLFYKLFTDHIKIYFIWDTRKKSYKR
jgi:plasmid stabilization system protein ParE